MYSSRGGFPKWVRPVAIFVASFLVLIIAYNMVTVNVGRGSVGVVFAKFSGGTQDVTIPQGVHVVAPWNSVTELPVVASTYTMSSVVDEGAKKGDDSIPYNTKDGQQGWYDVTLKISVNGKQAPLFYNVYQGKTFDNVITESVRYNLKNAINSVTIADTIQEAHLTKRNDIQTQAEKNLVDNLHAESVRMVNQYRANRNLPKLDADKIESLFVVYSMTLNGSKVDPRVQDQLNQIAGAEAMRQKAIKDAETAAVNAQKAVAQAGADYEAQMVNSKTVRSKADDEAYKQKAEQQNLTPLLIQKMLIEKLGPDVKVLDVKTVGIDNIFGINK